jgi:hypothetical protein
MKKLALVLLFSVLFCATSHAGLKVIGKGDNLQFDPTGFPPDMKAAYQLMKVKCVKCHTLERAVIAVQTGVAPITGTPFNQSATRAYGIKMMRKPDANITRQEAKTIVGLLNYLLDESSK